MNMMNRSIAAACLLALSACDGTTTPSADAGPRADGGDASVMVDRGPRTMAIDGDPNGLWWEASEQTLYIADDNGNRILRWTDAAGFSLVANLPAPSAQGAGLGQLVRTSDGTLVVTRFGYGTAGDIAFVTPAGDAHVVPSLDPQRRRIGLTIAPDGRLFDSYFVRVASGTAVGAVAQLDLAGTETDVVMALQKPVGVLALADHLFISDQTLGQILQAPLSAPGSFTVLATLTGPDLLAPGPNGSVFTGGASGTVSRIDSAGQVSVLVSGLLSARGVAYDADHARVFVAEHDPNNVANTIRILPAD